MINYTPFKNYQELSTPLQNDLLYFCKIITLFLGPLNGPQPHTRDPIQYNVKLFGGKET